MFKPENSEYDPYYETYISLVKNDDILGVLAGQPGELQELFAEMPEEKGALAYDEDKWTIKELLGHLIDGERMFAYRIFRISRADKTPIEGFEQDGYIENARSNSRSFSGLLEEFALLRNANMLFFKNLSDEDWLRTGTANNVGISVRALAYIMAGHITHHINILRTRYLR
ncbi:MAG: DinB family protein [Acidobacteriota bacterium]|nr:DinB family protein [Acidobacteriota bacterium]